jgi:hypothetical protein
VLSNKHSPAEIKTRNNIKFRTDRHKLGSAEATKCGIGDGVGFTTATVNINVGDKIAIL